MTIDARDPLAGEVRVVTTADGTRLHTVSAGDGPTVVLAHGFAIDSDEWNVVADSLVARGFRIVAFDQRGHGRSTTGSDGIGSRQMSGDYVAVLEAYDVTDAVLVMHSMGGFIGVRFLVENPEVVAQRLRGAMLVATFAGDVNRDNAQNRLQIPLIRSGILPWLVRSDIVGKPFARTLMGENQTDAMVEAFLRMFRGQDLGALVPILEAMVHENRYPDLGTISLPCTILVGSKDKTTPPFHTDDLHAGIAGSRLVRVPGAGHTVNWEAADVIVAEIEALAGRG
ncbi:MAG: alpha/beta fold hydrolase [Candidatus Nanopelagicales bacterium]